MTFARRLLQYAPHGAGMAELHTGGFHADEVDHAAAAARCTYPCTFHGHICFGSEAAMIGMQTEIGTEKTQMAVFATTVIKGKIIYYYLFSPFAGADTVTKMLAKHK